jgi:hypothetical protein
MAFQPKVLNPLAEPWFVRSLRQIDSDLRVVWGYNRYLVNQWAIERKIPPERYFKMYESVLTGDAPRIVMQPVFDSNQSVTDEEGNFISYKQIGVREFDLAPEYEWVRFEKVLNASVLTAIKRSYAWERNHPLSRIRVEKQRELEENKAKAKKRRLANINLREAVTEAQKNAGVKVQFGYGKSDTAKGRLDK